MHLESPCTEWYDVLSWPSNFCECGTHGKDEDVASHEVQYQHDRFDASAPVYENGDIIVVSAMSFHPALDSAGHPDGNGRLRRFDV